MSKERIDLYLNWSQGEYYTNNKREQALINKFVTLYTLAKSAKDNLEETKPSNLDKWRRAYYGVLGALKRDGTESPEKSRQVDKLVYEMVESKIDNTLPMPKITPRYKSDLPVVDITENYLKFEADRILTKFENDKNERSTYVDGTTWYKIWWDSLDNTHERSGNVKIETCTVDQITPQPGVDDYRLLEYIFEERQLSISRIYDLYGRLITPVSRNTNVVDVISCYYLNEKRIVGLFMWAKNSQQVICNEKNWQIRKLRTCSKCGAVVPQEEVCPVCGSQSFRYKNAEKEILAEDLYEIYNPYEVGETEDISQKDMYKQRLFLTAGTEIPFYQIRQLPFVPRPAVSAMNSLYGISESRLLLENQDMSNKLLTKAADKTLKSGAVVTKPEKMKISDTNDTFKIFGVRTAEEAAMVQTKQIVADTSQDLALSQQLYLKARQASGVTESFQGQKDSSAISGIAKQYAAMQSAGRIESLRVMKAAAFAGVYELMLKFLLAFSDEKRQFVKVLPNGNQEEMVWSKYMFLAKDKYGNIYYRDDFSFNTDPAATLSQNRQQMWQETQDKFINGAFGNPSDPRTMELFWNVMASLSYPLAKVALAGIKDNSQHLPYEIEQALMQNPEILQRAILEIESQGEQRGGARENSGPAGNGATHAANVERTNERNRSQNREIATSAQLGGV